MQASFAAETLPGWGKSLQKLLGMTPPRLLMSKPLGVKYFSTVTCTSTTFRSLELQQHQSLLGIPYLTLAVSSLHRMTSAVRPQLPIGCTSWKSLSDAGEWLGFPVLTVSVRCCRAKNSQTSARCVPCLHTVPMKEGIAVLVSMMATKNL